jgi:uncharacterized iron-regulated membrane protein
LQARWIASLSFDCVSGVILFLVAFTKTLSMPWHQPSRRVVWQPAHTQGLSASSSAKEPRRSQTCRK